MRPSFVSSAGSAGRLLVMPTVYLGNVNPLDESAEGRRVTAFSVPDDTDILEALTSITRAYDEYHSADPPEWVESSDPDLASLIARKYTWGDGDGREAHTCDVGRPDDYDG